MLLLVLFHLEQMSTSLDVVPIGTNHLPKCHWAFCYKLLATAGNADDVRLTPTSGGKADIPKPTLWANNRHPGFDRNRLLLARRKRELKRSWPR
jgi:hypothetical protein